MSLRRTPTQVALSYHIDTKVLVTIRSEQLLWNREAPMTTTVHRPSATLMAATAHHAELLERLAGRVEAFVETVRSGSSPEPSRSELLDFLRADLVPHTRVEDDLLYRAVRTDKTALLGRAMQHEHRVIAALIDDVEQGATNVDAAIAAGALLALCEVRIAQENTHLLPALEAAGLDLSELLGNRPELVGSTA